MNRPARPFGRTLYLLAVTASLSFWVSCSEQGQQSSSDYSVARQSIYYGTRAPSITNLTEGERDAIGFLADSAGDMFCTATLIDRDVAITARHCVEGTLAVDQMRFGLGHPGNPSAMIPIHSAPYHSQLDVALLFLQEDAISLVPSAEPLFINRVAPDESLVGTEVEAAGFGQTHDGSEGLYFVALELTSIESNHLVVNGWGEKGICFGDSGGPLFLHVDDDQPVIAGVESYGDSSCVDRDFETRLDLAVDWIDQQMEAFDPTQPADTGSQGEEWDLWCIPVGGSEWSGGLGTQLTWSQGTKACPPGTVALCTTPPDVRLPATGLGLLAIGIMLWAVRRRPVAVAIRRP